MLENIIVTWNLYKMTTLREGGMQATARGSRLGQSSWGKYPCYVLNFAFSNLTGRIIDFGDAQDLFPIEPPKNQQGRVVVAFDMKSVIEYAKNDITTADLPAYLVIDTILSKESSSKARRILEKTMATYNTQHGFSKLSDYNGFSVGNFLDDDSVFI